VNRNEVEELIMGAAAAAGLNPQTIRIGDTSVILGSGIGSERDDDEGNTVFEDALDQEGPFEPLAYLQALEAAAYKSACQYARLGSRATRAIAQRSLGDVLDLAILRSAVEYFESARILHEAVVRDLDLLAPPATPREMLRPITLDRVLGMVARQRALHKAAS
jgi:hypothetical protein